MSSPLGHPVLYQICRAGDRFEVGDGPTSLVGLTELSLGRASVELQNPVGFLPVDDPWMSSRHARLFSVGSDVVIEDLGSTNGVLVNGERIERAPLRHNDIVETGRTFWVFRRESSATPPLQQPLEFGNWATWSPTLAPQLARLLDEATSARHALLSGPHGAGKGFLARTLHLMSARRGRFVHLDCRERHPGRLAVDLFGDTGHVSRLEEAAAGTLFLEHVDGLPMDLQRRLAEGLARAHLSRGGATVPLRLRVVGSTNLDIEQAIDQQRLDPKLIERIGDLTVFLPGLEERLCDFGLLIDDFLGRARGAESLTREAVRALLRFPWAMQVKALARVLEAAAALASRPGNDGRLSGVIDLEHLPLALVGSSMPHAAKPVPVGLQTRQPDELPSERPVGPRLAPSTSRNDPFEEPTDDPEDVTDPHGRVAPRLRQSAALEKSDEVSTSTRRDLQEPARLSQRARGKGTGLSPEERSYASVVHPDRIADALRKTRGNVSAASRHLGKPRTLVLRWIREFGLDPEHYRDS
ncbi:MAG: sigma 54-interacting transcriptional regulator [Myxococcota bacterium]